MKRIKAVWILRLLFAISTTMLLVGCGGNTTPAVQTEEAYSASQEVISTPELIPTLSEESATSSEEVAEPSVGIESEEIVPIEETVIQEEEELNEVQKNSIAMLNYLAVLSKEIDASKNSRMFLEEAYASLINNTNPQKVNELTESHLSSMLDIIEKYRMISVKRERLQYIYNQNKAKRLKEAIPNPIGLLSIVNSFDLKRLAASAIYMAVDSYSSYQTYITENEQEFLQDGWVLDDEEAENLHESRKRAFMFMLEIVREDDIPGELALNESAVEKFVSWKNKTNNYQKIQFFESEKETYQAFGNYWLILADCYYESGDYEKCLEAMDKYEKLQANIFRKDYYFAQTLPKAIIAASEIYSDEEYISLAEKYLELMITNTESDDWSLRYFVAEIYLDLYAKTRNQIYIEKAYEIVLNNVNNLVAEQLAMNTVYLEDVKEVTIPEDATKDEKKQIKEYNKFLKEQRKVELPPVYEPLVLNCDLLFALAGKLDINKDEKDQIEGILHESGEALFLSEALENQYTFSSDAMVFEAKFDKDMLVIPVVCVSERSVIKVTVNNNEEEIVYDDWEVKEVKRSSGEGIAEYTVAYTSKKAGAQVWSDNTTVKVEIFMDEVTDKAAIILNFKVSKYKDLWLISDTVEFEQVN